MQRHSERQGSLLGASLGRKGLRNTNADATQLLGNEGFQGAFAQRAEKVQDLVSKVGKDAHETACANRK